MHDPMTVAHEIRWPIKRKPKNDWERNFYKCWPWSKRQRVVPRQPFIVIWHVDPELDGSDDSCNWFDRDKYSKRLGTNFYERIRALPEAEKELFWLLESILGPKRPWYRHPRWHVWHWQIQVPAWQALRRWLFTRCAGCGKRFLFGYSPVSTQWQSERPKWFCSEKHVYHEECCPGSRPAGTPAGEVSVS